MDLLQPLINLGSRIASARRVRNAVYRQQAVEVDPRRLEDTIPVSEGEPVADPQAWICEAIPVLAVASGGIAGDTLEDQTEYVAKFYDIINDPRERERLIEDRCRGAR